MNLGIKNKRVLISGGSNGIGKELAFQFAKEGCKVTLIARSESKLKKIVKKIGGKRKGGSIGCTPPNQATTATKQSRKSNDLVSR